MTAIRSRCCTFEETDMLDLFFVTITILFFVAAWAFVKGCDRL